MVPTLRNGLRVVSITLSRSTAPVEVREPLACQEWSHLLTTFVPDVREWALLATCHRFELYVVVESEKLETLCHDLQQMLTGVIAGYSDFDFEGGSAPWIIRVDNAAAEHLCRVAAGLDSLVLGEAQIQGQVITSYTQALEAGTIGPLLSALFRGAIRVGKRARTETHISTQAVSMSSVALNMAARYFDNFSDLNVLVIGAGEMSRLALKALRQRNVRRVTVANRTLSRAQSVLLHTEWQAIPLDRVPDVLVDFDVVFSATSALDVVVTQEDILTAQAKSGQERQQVLIDLAVPRDIDPAIRNLPGIAVLDVDDLRHGLDQSLENRKHALPAVNDIIEEEMMRWQAEQRELSMRPYVVELRQRAERIRQQEVEKTMRFLGSVDSETQEHIQHLSRALVNKILHEPTVRIKELAHTDELDVYVTALCDIFGLEANGLASNQPHDTKLSRESSRS